MSEIKRGGLDQYGAEPFEQQQFEPTGVRGVNIGSFLYGCLMYTLQMWFHVYFDQRIVSQVRSGLFIV